MNAITNFFRKGLTTTQKPLSPETSTLNEFPNQLSTVIDENLFVEKNPPIEESEPTATSESILQNFLDQDFFNNGYQDGYQYHTQDMISNRLKQIKAEFRYVVDRVIETKRTKVAELQCQCLDVDEISERLRKKLQIHIDSIKTSIERLSTEKELSVGDEGLVMHPLHKYRNGFIRGLELYHEEKILGDCTGLFNI